MAPREIYIVRTATLADPKYSEQQVDGVAEDFLERLKQKSLPKGVRFQDGIAKYLRGRHKSKR